MDPTSVGSSFVYQTLINNVLVLFCRSNPNKPNEAILVFGDVLGQVNALLFSAANIALFDRPSQPAGNKQGGPS